MKLKAEMSSNEDRHGCLVVFESWWYVCDVMALFEIFKG